MMSKPSVSVIITTFNRKHIVPRAINSALNQTYRDMEVIVVNDCSTDKTEALLGALAKRHGNLRVHHNRENKGVSASRNIGIELARGGYINFLDDDDEFFPRKIEKQLKKFQENSDPKLGFVLCGIELIRPDGTKKIRRNRLKGDLYKTLLKRYAISAVHTPLIKADVFKEGLRFDEVLASHEYYDLWIQASKKYTFDFVDEVLCRYNSADSKSSKDFKDRTRSTHYFFRKHARDFSRAGFRISVYSISRYIFLIIIYFTSHYISPDIFKFIRKKWKKKND